MKTKIHMQDQTHHKIQAIMLHNQAQQLADSLSRTLPIQLMLKLCYTQTKAFK